MITKADKLFTPECISEIILTIEKNDYNEVVFVGNLSREGKISDIDVITFGNESSAPVILMDVLKGDVLIHNHPALEGEEIKDVLRPSDADINLASEIAKKRIGFYIIDNRCEWVNVIYKPEPRYYLNEEEILNIFKEGGLVEKNITNFEPRKEQLELVNLIVDAINSSKILISEAGTGTGKSLSYLIPSAVWSVMNKKRVFISTHTINLQQQIAYKDMQIVERVLKAYTGKNINFSVLIGRSNYLCKYKLNELLNDIDRQQTLFPEESDTGILNRIAEWSKTTSDGILGEISFPISDEIREEISSDTENCLRKKCPFNDDCFYYRARLEAEKSNIIIANHSLVFSSIDEESKRISLPFFSGIVFDEAHHLEETALKSLAKDFSLQGILYQLRKIYHTQNNKAFGFLALLNKKVNLEYVELQNDYEKLTGMISEIYSQVNQFLKETLESVSLKNYESNAISIDGVFCNTKEYKEIVYGLEDIFKNINRFITKFEDFSEEIRDTSNNTKVSDIITFLSYRIRRLEEIESIFNLIFKTENEINFVKWLEISKRNVKFCYSPLEVGDFLSSPIFSKKDFTIFTSATLTINQRFDYFKSSVGLAIATNKEKTEASFPSPFDYEKQAEILIIKENTEHKEFSSKKFSLIKELVMISEGGALILFTSYKRMQEYFNKLKDEFIENGLIAIKQGDEPRNILLSKMKQINNCVLFATSSFWEGIDVPGENLRLVIIEKIPFDSVGDPIYTAKIKLLEHKGQNPFITYSLPRAILKLKQGMGRLIRSKQDRGIIVILDNRILTKSYSKAFLNSLPPAKRITGDLERLIAETKRFFKDW
ncbi:MAG: ATP-dependent DNA helicase [Brevinematia bacterium]